MSFYFYIESIYFELWNYASLNTRRSCSTLVQYLYTFVRFLMNIYVIYNRLHRRSCNIPFFSFTVPLNFLSWTRNFIFWKRHSFESLPGIDDQYNLCIGQEKLNFGWTVVVCFASALEEDSRVDWKPSWESFLYLHLVTYENASCCSLQTVWLD